METCMNQIGILYVMVVVSQDIENLVLQTFFYFN